MALAGPFPLEFSAGPGPESRSGGSMGKRSSASGIVLSSSDLTDLRAWPTASRWPPPMDLPLIRGATSPRKQAGDRRVAARWGRRVPTGLLLRPSQVEVPDLVIVRGGFGRGSSRRRARPRTARLDTGLVYLPGLGVPTNSSAHGSISTPVGGVHARGDSMHGRGASVEAPSRGGGGLQGAPRHGCRRTVPALPTSSRGWTRTGPSQGRAFHVKRSRPTFAARTMSVQAPAACQRGGRCCRVLRWPSAECRPGSDPPHARARTPRRRLPARTATRRLRSAWVVSVLDDVCSLGIPSRGG